MRRTAGILLATLAAALSPLAARAAHGVPSLDPVEVARDLEAVSVSGSSAAVLAERRRRLLSWIRAAGLEQIEPASGAATPTGDPRSENAGERSRSDSPSRSGTAPAAGVLTGILPGSVDGDVAREVILVIVLGHPGDPSWPRDARRSAVALAALSELAAVPRHHAVRLLLLERGETVRAVADRWIDSLSADGRARLLAVVDLQGVGDSANPPIGNDTTGIVRLAPIGGEGASSLPMTPAWLVHATLAAGHAVGEPLAVAAARLTLAAQWLARSTVATDPAAGDAFLAAGIPAVSIGGTSLWEPPTRSSREETGPAAPVVSRQLAVWKLRLTALSRRLDLLDGRPRPDTEYLAWLGRVWSRRDLYWAGLVIWIALVFSGLPGRWRHRTRAERVAVGRRYLPGFAARGLLLVTILALPVPSLFLLLPAAIAWVAAVWIPLPRRLVVAVAAAPWVAWGAGIAWLLVTDRAEALALGLPALALLGATFVTVSWVVSRDQVGPTEQ